MSKCQLLPYFTSGLVVKGFGRGSKALGVPTANLPQEVVDSLPNDFELGIYFGWTSLEGKIHKSVMSIGWNPFYKNTKKSMEVHLLHKFSNDFYGKMIKVVIAGYIRPEKDFSSVEELIREIKNDISIADEKLNEPSMMELKDHSFLKS